MAHRMSLYSVQSESPGGPRGAGQQSTQVSTTTLLNAVHNIYLSGQPYKLDAGSSLVVNSWLTATQPAANGAQGGTVDPALGARAWEHARRRAEDGCVVLGSLHTSTPSLLAPFLASLPVAVPEPLFTALSAIRPFVHCVTPHNPSAPRQSALAVTLTLSLTGNLTAASLALSQSGIDAVKGLLDVPAEPGYRAFDVFYYLLTSASTPAEREFLSLKPAANYTLLSKSETYGPPAYLPTADDGAAADDFRAALKAIGIKGSSHRNLISILAGLLKLGNTLDYNIDEDVLDDVCEDVSGLLGLEPEQLARQCTTDDRRTFVGGLYEALVDWVISKANDAIARHMARTRDDLSDAGRASDGGDSVSLTVIEIPDPALGKAVALRGIFDDALGINVEMKQDNVDVIPAGSSVIREMQNAVAEVAPDLGIMTGPVGRDRLFDVEKREAVLERLAHAADGDCFLRKLLFPVADQGINLGRKGRIDLPALLSGSRVWYHLSLHPTDDSPASLAALPSITSAWSAGTVSRQLRAWRLPEWANRRNKHLDFTADFDFDEFTQRYRPLGCQDGREGIESWLLERGWSNGEVVLGAERVWMRENAWWEAESMLDIKPSGQDPMASMVFSNPVLPAPLGSGYSMTGSNYFPPAPVEVTPNNSNEQLVNHQRSASRTTIGRSPLAAPSVAPTAPMRVEEKGDYGLGNKGDTYKGQVYYTEEGEFVGTNDPELARATKIQENRVTFGRRAWVAFVWALTFWIPSPILRFVGRMKRPDVRMAWREKLVLCFIILIINAIIVFWIIWFGPLLCPNWDKAWSQKEVATHQGNDDFWVSFRGGVYDISKFWKQQHSDTSIKTTTDEMQPFAGLNVDNYFPPPMNVVCPGLGIADSVQLLPNASSVDMQQGLHTSGSTQPDVNSKLNRNDWYANLFLPRMKEFYHGQLVWDTKQISQEGSDSNHMWVIYKNKVYDLTNYFYTLTTNNNIAMFKFLDDDVAEAVQNGPGTDVTNQWNSLIQSSLGNTTAYNSVMNSLNCIDNLFYVGAPDFRSTARCQANNWIMLAFAIILCLVIGIKFISALQFGSKRRPSPQDKFVICQVPAYTEGEDSLRKALDSLTALQYDNKRKLICVICDGIIVGAGNDRPTPKIVLDILGVDPKTDPAALPFKSVGVGSEQLNYGKVYSGLYEYEGNVVPYLVIVKVGKESEQEKAKPGNRGKRDSQIMLMSFLNRVHHRAPMNPLELEMFHQINNIIGVDPELYEYLLMVDADTCVREDSLNRLVAACANNSKIAGICGETSLQNEERSWWTMIQVYEYFISHHLAKAFESLFGSVTCLPGCFSMYRLRTADKGRPLIISDGVIREYSDCHVDTLHKKNLLSLGEDRYLTTLMTKYFPHMSYKFIPDAYCQTAAPEKWSVLLSQRRRWINSTIHNLVELIRLREMCGFCCFSMRFVVFIDLCGTIILPGTCVYLGYLIYRVATHQGAFPLLSLIMIAAVYGLQALVFVLKRQWQHIGWMIIYIIAFPVYSFVLPIYSFWNQDNFSWGNTRIVIGEKGNKQIVAINDDGFDPRSIPLQRWDDYALSNNLPGRRGFAGSEKQNDGMDGAGAYVEATSYEMDDMKSVYSSVRQGSVLRGLPGSGPGSGSNSPGGPTASAVFLPPQSPAPQFASAAQSRASLSPYGAGAGAVMDANRQSMLSVGTAMPPSASAADIQRFQSPYQDLPRGAGASMTNLRQTNSTSPSNSQITAGNRMSTVSGLGYTGGRRTPQPFGADRSTTPIDFQRGSPGAAGAPDDATIIDGIQAVLREVDLDTVTKKQVRALVEQRLQTGLVGERRTFMDRQIDNELANM